MYLNANYLLQQDEQLFENSCDFNNFIHCLNSVSKNHEVFESLTQNCQQLDKDKSTVSTFLVILINNYAVITTQKSSYVESSSFGQQRFVFAHPFPYISKKSRKFHFES